MRYIEDQGIWYAEQELGDGRYGYKFVVDESEWLADGTNPDTEPDGFGGVNSVAVMSCEAMAPMPDNIGSVDWARGLPNEPRKGVFHYDNHAELLNVTPAHLDTYLKNAEVAGRFVREQRAQFLPCTTEDASCARQFVSSFGARAFRRELSVAQLERYVMLFDAQESFADGVEVLARVLLASPSFLYRFEIGDTESAVSTLTGLELATALSYTYWGGPPDAALLDAARSGALDDPVGRGQHVDRLLADPRARAQFRHIARMWFGLDKLPTASKNAAQFPGFDDALRADLEEQVLRFVEYIVFDQRGSIDDLLSSPVMFLNPRLAQFYGVGQNVAGWTRFDEGIQGRVGLLGHAGILAVTSHSDQTSPILRGLFVREALLCQEFPPPPANAGGVPEVDPNASTRERFAQHSDDAACSGCHSLIDDIGFGLEHYDPVGLWREREAGHPIDDTGVLRNVDGPGTTTQVEFEGLGQLARLIASARSLKACASLQLERHAYGFKEEEGDRCARAAGGLTSSGEAVALIDVWRGVATTPRFAVRREDGE